MTRLLVLAAVLVFIVGFAFLTFTAVVERASRSHSRCPSSSSCCSPSASSARCAILRGDEHLALPDPRPQPQPPRARRPAPAPPPAHRRSACSRSPCSPSSPSRSRPRQRLRRHPHAPHAAHRAAAAARSRARRPRRPAPRRALARRLAARQARARAHRHLPTAAADPVQLGLRATRRARGCCSTSPPARSCGSATPTCALPIASLTKMMTALLTVHSAPPDAPVLITRQAVDMAGSKVGVLPLGQPRAPREHALRPAAAVGQRRRRRARPARRRQRQPLRRRA